jgi:hypothetical protein
MIAANNGSVALAQFAAEAGDHRTAQSMVHEIAAVRLPSNTLGESGHPGSSAQCQKPQFRLAETTWAVGATLIVAKPG